MAGDFRPRLVADGFVAKDDAADLDLLLDASAAMVGEARIVVADDPRPVEPGGELGQQLARARPAAARSRSGRGSCRRGNRAAARRCARPRRRARSASRANHRAAGTGRAARTSSPFRGAGRRPAAPRARAKTARREALRERFACERKGNHAAGLTAGRTVNLARITRSPRPTGSDAAERRRSGAAPRRLRSATPALRSRPPRRPAPSAGW